MKNLKIVFTLIILSSLGIHAQHTNTGATLTIQSGLNVYSEDALVNSSGTINNSGTLYLTGNLTNNATLNTTSGSVNLNGGNQTVGGSSVITFNNLSLTGSGTKSFSNNANVQGSLDLGSRELNTQGNTLTVTNTSPTAIVRTSGFVSSTSGGKLARNTADANDYLFPVGSSSGTTRYRPIEITPTSSAANTYTVRMANSSASSDGYNLSTTDGVISALNSAWYHIINRTSGSTSANVAIFYDSGSGESFTGVGHWTGSQWDDESPVTYAAGSPLSSIRIQNLSSFSPFALGTNPLAAVPTLSQWGLILLTLLTLTMVTLFIRKSQMATTAGTVNFSLTDTIKSAPFDKSGYLRILKLILPIAIIGFVLIHVFLGSNGALDFIGTISATFIAAYIAQLYFLMKKSN